MTIQLYGLTLTQQVVNPFFRFYSQKKKRKKKKEEEEEEEEDKF